MIKKRLLKYERKDHGGAIIWVNTMEDNFESNFSPN